MNDDTIYLQDIIPLEQYKKEGKVILVRHYHVSLDEMEEKDLIEEYQSFQGKSGFRNAKYLIVFLAIEKNRARFYGVYRVNGILDNNSLPSYSEDLKQYCRKLDPQTDFFLKLDKVNGFDKYKNRLIIDWIVPRGWYNTFEATKSKPVVKILPPNFIQDFPGLMNIYVGFFDLKQIIENPDSHSDWQESLTRLQAVYLILDNATGLQYIGTTYGEQGLWQRWESYVKGDGTGGNRELKLLKNKNSRFYENLRFSILEVLAKTADQKYCTNQESIWKRKLGTRAHGLNRN